MKKLVILVFCMAWGYLAVAQSSNVGISLSANIPTGYGYSMGFGGGVQGEFPLSKKVYLQPSVNYYRLYSRRVSLQGGTTVITARGSTDMINVSPAANIYLGDRAYLQAGPSLYFMNGTKAGITAGFGLKLPAGANNIDLGLRTENMISDGIFNFIAFRAAYCLSLKK
jgi:hypothetical protein